MSFILRGPFLRICGVLFILFSREFDATFISIESQFILHKYLAQNLVIGFKIVHIVVSRPNYGVQSGNFIADFRQLYARF